eukprot:TRINITY_DN15009_c0_g1_i1.p1 TRINITY_DN15009_c0_g1~~TRINITY_DN15009_c0_g1_i1.p1  ORF type:complete len:244 (+),score=36.52 TRINITY_DN15009_c0_g1_i1:194-925(+)
MDYNSIAAHDQIARYNQLVNNSNFTGLPAQYATYNATPANRINAGGSISSPPTSTSDAEDNSDNESNSSSSGKKRQRGNYKCRKCGQPKKGHSCPFFSSDSQSPPDPSTPDTENPSGPVSSSAPIQSTSAALLGLVSGAPLSLEDQQLYQRLRELEHENLLIQHENNQLRDRLIGLGYGTAIQQLQLQMQSYAPASGAPPQYVNRPQTHMNVGGVPIGYPDSLDWSDQYAIKKRRLHESGDGY